MQPGFFDLDNRHEQLEALGDPLPKLNEIEDWEALYACPQCGRECSAHDFQEKSWRHLNFFQHHCHVHASVPRVKCPEHGVKLASAPWARKGSAFTLLFEQAAMALVREMPPPGSGRSWIRRETRQ